MLMPTPTTTSNFSVVAAAAAAAAANAQTTGNGLLVTVCSVGNGTGTTQTLIGPTVPTMLDNSLSNSSASTPTTIIFQQPSQKDTTWTKLFVGGLPYHTTDKSLRDHFKIYGEIEEAVVITDRQTGKSRGYGFVIMADRISAERAYKEPNPIIDGRKANVNLAVLGAKPRNTVSAAAAASAFPFTALRGYPTTPAILAAQYGLPATAIGTLRAGGATAGGYIYHPHATHQQISAATYAGTPLFTLPQAASGTTSSATHSPALAAAIAAQQASQFYDYQAAASNQSALVAAQQQTATMHHTSSQQPNYAGATHHPQQILSAHHLAAATQQQYDPCNTYGANYLNAHHHQQQQIAAAAAAAAYAAAYHHGASGNTGTATGTGNSLTHLGHHIAVAQDARLQ